MKFKTILENSSFLKYWKNARTVITQIKNDEWEFGSYTAERKDQSLWIGNGGWVLELYDNGIPKHRRDVFGFILRHYV